MDLKQLLPQLIPAAITWVEEHAAKIEREGQPLCGSELDIARRVGVQQPEKIRVSVVHAIPLPEDGSLRDVARAQGVLGPGTAGITFGHGIYLVQRHVSDRLLSHECRHVHQYEKYGSIAEFLQEYLRQVADFGYFDAPLEVDARLHESVD